MHENIAARQKEMEKNLLEQNSSYKMKSVLVKMAQQHEQNGTEDQLYIS